MYKTAIIKDIQHRLDGFAFNQLISLMHKRRTRSGFAFEVEDHKCIVISKPLDDYNCTLAMWIIKNRCQHRRKTAPTHFTFFFT